MNEVEKMYENAGIKPYIYCSKPQLDCNARETGNCKQECEYYSGEKLLTPFTAEKQIELVKWLMINMKDYQYDVEDNKFWFYIDDCRETKYREFEEALAELINLYWQDLTEEERKQIKEILE